MGEPRLESMASKFGRADPADDGRDTASVMSYVLFLSGVGPLVEHVNYALEDMGMLNPMGRDAGWGAVRLVTGIGTVVASNIVYSGWARSLGVTTGYALSYVGMVELTPFLTRLIPERARATLTLPGPAHATRVPIAYLQDKDTARAQLKARSGPAIVREYLDRFEASVFQGREEARRKVVTEFLASPPPSADDVKALRGELKNVGELCFLLDRFQSIHADADIGDCNICFEPMNGTNADGELANPRCVVMCEEMVNGSGIITGHMCHLDCWKRWIDRQPAEYIDESSIKCYCCSGRLFKQLPFVSAPLRLRM